MGTSCFTSRSSKALILFAWLPSRVTLLDAGACFVARAQGQCQHSQPPSDRQFAQSAAFRKRANHFLLARPRSEIPQRQATLANGQDHSKKWPRELCPKGI